MNFHAKTRMLRLMESLWSVISSARWLAPVCLGLTAVEASAATKEEQALAAKLVGTWELVSYQVEDQASGKLINAMGDTPRGRVIFTESGWVAFNLEGSDRQAATTDGDRAQLLKTLVAYIGRYRVEGTQWVTKVETAWAPEWVGTEQRREVSIDGEYANVLTPWRNMPNFNEGRPSRSIIRFHRVQ